MEPTYMMENKYSYLVSAWRQPLVNIDYAAETPETTFERKVQLLFMEGQNYLHNEEYLLALNSFRELMALILYIVNPQLEINYYQTITQEYPLEPSLVEKLSKKAAEILKGTSPIEYNFPPNFISKEDALSQPVKEILKPSLKAGLRITSYHKDIQTMLNTASKAIELEDYKQAVENYNVALGKVPVTDTLLQASLLHDMAILAEKSGNTKKAIEYGKKSIELFEKTKEIMPYVQALEMASGIMTRSGNDREAASLSKRAAELRKKSNLNPVSYGASRRLTSDPAASGVERRPVVFRPINRIINEASGIATGRSINRAAISLNRNVIRPVAEAHMISGYEIFSEASADAPLLMGIKYIKPHRITKNLEIWGSSASVTISLDNSATESIKDFLRKISVADDLALVTNYWATYIQMVAYLPHMYFFIIPMAMGDCLYGMGNLEQAEQQYRSVLVYPYINKKYEIVKLWTRLAQVYMELGDRSYKGARDNAGTYGTARAFYENIVKPDKTLKAGSPLYQDTKFTSIKSRITNFLAASNPLSVNENPSLTIPVMEALTKLQQINAGLNYFGFAPNYTPPFSFEYMQNTARYFAQQASQIEQRYIQYKSQAENETLRREHLDQQAEVARQSVILEQRGVAEAEAGISVAEACLNYAEMQRQNAIETKDDFNAVRWELLELSEIEAWANAAAVDKDDEVKQTISGFHYYNASDRRRSLVVADLAYRRTRVSHDLEAGKLQREIDAASAYKELSQTQLNQAMARKKAAEQRVIIARLQERQSEENRDYLDMREFSARLWYELALRARKIKERYLDMSTEIAVLMERAYNAETERGLRVIRYNYNNTTANNLMGADQLLTDIDYFTYDYTTTTKTKKIPVKQSVSLADTYPMAFHKLKSTGRCFFQTELSEFDLQHPGMYLCKLRNVELIFVGIATPSSFHGTLRNIGISRFRRENGTIINRMYPADVMELSQYEIRQDALAFRFNPNELRLFENNGIDTLWQLDLPFNANGFDYNELLDIHLVIYYDGFFSPGLETSVKAALPTGGNASKALSLKMSFFDEFYYLKNSGEAELEFTAGMFPRNQENIRRTQVIFKFQGKSGTVGGLTMRLTSANHGSELIFTTDSEGEVKGDSSGGPLANLLNEALPDNWSLIINAEDNPHLLENGKLNLKGISDILIFFEYTFDYKQGG